jgi:UDP-glucose 4-epimerase
VSPADASAARPDQPHPRIALITGGAGFLGGHLAEHLVRDGWEVRVLDRSEPRLDVAVTWVDDDVRDLRAVTEAATSATMVFHLAAVVGVQKLLDDPLEAIDVTIDGTRAALAAASAAGAGLVHLSTSEVLGTNPAVPWDEGADRMLGPAHVDRWAYASAKATAEHIVLAGARLHHIAATVVRPFNVYGPRQSPSFVVPAMVAAALADRPISVHDGGSQTRCFTYVDDVVDALVALADKPGLGPILHLGSLHETSVAELARLVATVTGTTRAPTHDSTASIWGEHGGRIDRRVPDAGLALDLLAWSATTSLDEGLRRTVEWAREDGARFGWT